MMFFLTDGSGDVNGPHTVGAVRRKLEAGELRWEDLVREKDGNEWVPARVYEDLLDERKLAATSAPKRQRPVCSACGGEHVQRCRVIWESGTTTSVSRGSFGGFASDGEGGYDPMIGGGTTRSTGSTYLAAKCAPPKENDFAPQDSSAAGFILLCLLAVGTALVFASGSTMLGFILLTATAGVLILTLSMAPTKAQIRAGSRYYKEALEKWDQSFFCHRCGHMGRAETVEA